MAISKVIYKTSAQDTGTVWMDSTQATAAAADITAPKTAMLANGVMTTGTGSGGGSVTVEEKDVNFIDYDGTILYSYTAADFASLSALPANPSHAGLTAQGWNWSLSDAKTYVASYGKLWIGQKYITSDGKTHIHVHMVSPVLSPYLFVYLNGTISIDWGDNSSADTMTGTDLNTVYFQGHTYANAGDYDIAIEVVSGKMALRTSSNAYSSILSDGTTIGNSRTYSNCIKSIYIGDDTGFGLGAMANLCALEKITIPDSAFFPSETKNYFFTGCTNIKCIVIPDGFANMGNNMFQNCSALKTVSLPNNMLSTGGTYTYDACYALENFNNFTEAESIYGYCFRSCYLITDLIISEGVTSLGNYALRYCYSLAKITLPSSLTSIGTYVFNGNYALKELHVRSTTPPTISNANAFTNAFAQNAVIYVPRGKLTAYQTASNWSTYASYMQEEPA